MDSKTKPKRTHEIKFLLSTDRMAQLRRHRALAGLSDRISDSALVRWAVLRLADSLPAARRD